MNRQEAKIGSERGMVRIGPDPGSEHSFIPSWRSGIENDSAHSAEQYRDVEVDEHTDATACRLEIGTHLDPVNRCQDLNSLELDDDAARDQEVKAALAYAMTLVLHVDRNLPAIWEIPES